MCHTAALVPSPLADDTGHVPCTQGDVGHPSVGGCDQTLPRALIPRAEFCSDVDSCSDVESSPDSPLTGAGLGLRRARGRRAKEPPARCTIGGDVGVEVAQDLPTDVDGGDAPESVAGGWFAFSEVGAQWWDGFRNFATLANFVDHAAAPPAELWTDEGEGVPAGEHRLVADADTADEEPCFSLRGSYNSPTCLEEELSKWHTMLAMGMSTYRRVEPRQFRQLVQGGIPPALRWTVWKAAVLDDYTNAAEFEALCDVKNAWTARIEADVHRTFGELAAFDRAQQQRLLRVLNAYAAFDPKVGYCQGMNFVAGLLLFVSDDEAESFALFVWLMQQRQLGDFYKEDFPLLHRYVGAYGRLLAEVLPDLSDHFNQEGVVPALYLHRWFLTLFTDAFPVSVVLVFWDIIICDGIPVILNIAISIMRTLQELLLERNQEDIVWLLGALRIHDGIAEFSEPLCLDDDISEPRASTDSRDAAAAAAAAAAATAAATAAAARAAALKRVDAAFQETCIEGEERARGRRRLGRRLLEHTASAYLPDWVREELGHADMSSGDAEDQGSSLLFEAG
eukprot:NODE_2844_length_2132_cov_13.691272.p1 GENE.NODE_2844_length_2132_cov_13.691272~~NODE_2844_length_2132_cov_13.691272.p1  ORF type:complete len:565 (+),score=121.72 NODE_2844_length_2132_cov_13.691272:154-1848(+)